MYETSQVYYYGSTIFSSGEEGNILHLRKLNQPFAWQEEVEGRNVSEEAVATCRNSVQGRETIADDRGYVCDRSELLASGCCDANSSTAGRFLCTSCDQVQSLLFNATSVGFIIDSANLTYTARWLPVVALMKIA